MVNETLRRSLEHDIEGIAASSRRITANGISLHLLDYPGPGRQPIVIIPGITTCAIGWDFVASALREKRRVIVLDVRGRGLSDHPAHGYGLHDYAGDLAKAIETLQLDEPVLLGHSMGARIAAATAIFHPEVRLSGLLLAEPPLSGPGRPRYPVPLCDLLTQIRRARSGMVAEDVAKRYPAWPPRELTLRARWLATCSDAAVTATHRSFECDDFFDLWDALELPVLIYGERSAVVTQASVAELRRRNRHARIHKVRSAAHMLPWENYSETMRLLENALHGFASERTMSQGDRR
jgi:N-formylmaleamate deformylase